MKIKVIYLVHFRLLQLVQLIQLRHLFKKIFSILRTQTKANKSAWKINAISIWIQICIWNTTTYLSFKALSYAQKQKVTSKQLNSVLSRFSKSSSRKTPFTSKRSFISSHLVLMKTKNTEKYICQEKNTTHCCLRILNENLLRSEE